MKGLRPALGIPIGIGFSWGGIPKTLKGILLILISVSCFATMDATIRRLSGELHPFEIAFFRNFFGSLALLPLLVREGLGSLRTERLGLFALRGVLNTIAMLMFFWALSRIPLAEVTALSFTIPLFASLFAIWLLREQVYLQRWVALGLGFVGMIVLLRPGFQAVTVGAIAAVAASILLAWVTILIKILSRTESSITITAYMGLFQAPLSLLAAVWFWQWPGGEDWMPLLAIGCLGTLGQVMMIHAFAYADVSTLLPFQFSALIWATLYGFFWFGEWPDLWTWVGGAIIFGSSLTLAYRESRLKVSSTLSQ
ncbi:DMT family transporter [Thermostichus vulcanus]|uniref:DMT family transporter n=1 Tax=Thermostichus vulcanus str. 'Rupite' TaxID=2813851 RepID=A0ABT0CD48_THEVL|nr:DMT family transporter [Thermostichus vulcanus]MCJ2543709.1 DMT family transporter [Thermostichus vulcanus str. 'Rupite']